jgi:hypothetical protein
MDIDDDGGRREFGLRAQRRGTGSDKGTADLRMKDKPHQFRRLLIRLIEFL